MRAPTQAAAAVGSGLLSAADVTTNRVANAGISAGAALTPAHSRKKKSAAMEASRW